MEAGEPPAYDVTAMSHVPEDIVLCIDSDAQIETELRAPPGAKNAPPVGTSVTRLDAVRQALLLFVHAKLAIDSRHRFAIATMGETPDWHLRNFTGDVGAISTAVRSFRAAGEFPACDLQPLFRMLQAESRRSRADGRTLRLVLIFARSNVIPIVSQARPESAKTFTADAIYLHDRPSESNCPQAVYDTLVNTLEQVSEYETYIFETSSGLAKVLFRMICILLAHPAQRIEQDDLDLPKDIGKPPEPPGPIPQPVTITKESPPRRQR